MPAIPWTEEILIHVEIIDNQHKKLLTLLNDLYDAMNRGEDKEGLARFIGDMADYTFYHFMTEEKYFERFQYPEAIQHKNEHRYFAEQVAEFQNRFNQGETILSDDILLFLKSWINNHVKKNDQKLGLFLNERGVN